MPRVRLRPPRAEDGAQVDPWLPEAIAAIAGRAQPIASLTLCDLVCRWQAEHPSARTLLGELADGLVVGIMRLRDAGRGRLLMEALAVRADRRNLGYGLEMVMAAETGWPGRLALARVPRANGLALYFWLRAGYRPFYPFTGPDAEDLDPVPLWMARALGAGAPVPAL
jgi:GNAT superfamily N-acetyltransferase